MASIRTLLRALRRNRAQLSRRRYIDRKRALEVAARIRAEITQKKREAHQ